MVVQQSKGFTEIPTKGYPLVTPLSGKVEEVITEISCRLSCSESIQDLFLLKKNILCAAQEIF